MARKRIAGKWIAVAILGLAVSCPKVRAQCPSNSTSISPTTYSLLSPEWVAAQGNVAVTMYVAAAGPAGEASQNLTVTTGTVTTFSWNTWNAVSTSTTVSINGGTPQPYPQISGLSGNYTTESSAPVNLLFTITAKDQAGNTTQDRVSLNVVNGTAGTIIDQDEVPANLYAQASTGFGGSADMGTCGTFYGSPSHTATTWVTLTNTTSGESQSANGSSFTWCDSTCSSWEGLNPVVATHPGDTTTDTETDQIECTIAGTFFADTVTQGGPPNDHYTFKTMKTKIKIAQQGSTVNGVTRWYVDSWCKDTQHVPIWEPLYIDTAGGITPLIKVGQYELSYQECWVEPGWPNWQCPAITVTPPQPLHIGVGGTKYDCSTLLNTPIPK